MRNAIGSGGGGGHMGNAPRPSGAREIPGGSTLNSPGAGAAGNINPNAGRPAGR